MLNAKIGKALLGAIIALAIAAMPLLPAQALEPCCSVVAIDTAKGFVTIRDNKTGNVSQVAAGPAQLAKLRPAQAVDSDFGGR